MSINKQHFRDDKAFSQALASNQQQILTGVQVLLVEDEIDIAELLIILLEGVGAEIVWVTRSEEALVVLETLEPDILLCNVKLPGQDGGWLIQQIRGKETEQTTHLPAIAVTSYSREVVGEKMLELGFERFLSKIDDPDQLIAEVADLVQSST